MQLHACVHGRGASPLSASHVQSSSDDSQLLTTLTTPDSSDTHIHSIEAKRCKVDNDSATYLWHCRLGHIGVKRMKTSILMDFWNHLIMIVDACEPCLMGKMTKTSFSGTMEHY